MWLLYRSIQAAKNILRTEKINKWGKKLRFRFSKNHPNAYVCLCAICVLFCRLICSPVKLTLNRYFVGVILADWTYLLFVFVEASMATAYTNGAPIFDNLIAYYLSPYAATVSASVVK